MQKYINKQKTEACIIKKIITQLDISDVKSLNEYILIMDDWKGSNNLINSKSTLGIGMKRLLCKYFKKMYLINEINTSKISNLTHKETKNYVEIMRYNGKNLKN